MNVDFTVVLLHFMWGRVFEILMNGGRLRKFVSLDLFDGFIDMLKYCFFSSFWMNSEWLCLGEKIKLVERIVTKPIACKVFRCESLTQIETSFNIDHFGKCNPCECLKCVFNDSISYCLPLKSGCIFFPLFPGTNNWVTTREINSVIERVAYWLLHSFTKTKSILVFEYYWLFQTDGIVAPFESV